MSQREDPETRDNNRRTLLIRPPLWIGSPAAMGRGRRQVVIGSFSNQERSELRSTEATSPPPLPPSSYESIQLANKRGPRIKYTNDDGQYHHTVRRSHTFRGTVLTRQNPKSDEQNENENISLDKWIWKNGLLTYKKRIKEFVPNMSELSQLDPTEAEEMASYCKMGFAFKQRTMYAHQGPLVIDMEAYEANSGRGVE